MEEKNKKKIQAIEYCKRRNQRIGKFADSIEKNDLLSMFKASLSFLNKRGKKFNNPSQGGCVCESMRARYTPPTQINSNKINPKHHTE